MATEISRATTPSAAAKVLIADDSRVMRVALKKILSKEFSVVEAENGARAWDILVSDEDIQVVFTDLSMPGLDGFGLLARIRESKDDRLASLPVIIITGKEDDEDTKKDVIARGGNDFISKPFKGTHILARAHSYISHSATTSQLTETRKKLESESTIDPKTGLGSKRYFKKVAKELLAQIKRHGGYWIWLQINVDKFKQVYVEHGIETAESILEGVGRTICSTVREGDHAGSLAPGKFALILRSTDNNGAQILAERLRVAVEKSVFNLKGKSVRITTSTAIFSPSLGNDTNLDNILQEGKDLLAAATEAGGNTIIVAPPPDLPTIEQVSVTEAMQMLENGEEETVRQHRAGLLIQLLPLLKVIASDAKKEFDAFLEALKKTD